MYTPVENTPIEENPPSEDIPGCCSVISEFRTPSFWKSIRCEFLGTLLYTLVGCGACTRGDLERDTHVISVSLAFGLMYATILQCIGHISGGHINPAVTMAMLVTRHIGLVRAICYIIVQCLGAITGVAILYGVTPSHVHNHLGLTSVNHTLGMTQAFGVEFMSTFVIVFTIFTNSETTKSEMASRSLSIGLSVTAVHFFAVSIWNL